MIPSYSRLVLLIVALSSSACERSEFEPGGEIVDETNATVDPIASDPIGFLEKADAFWMTPGFFHPGIQHHAGENLRLAVIAALHADTAVDDFANLLKSEDGVSTLYGLVGLYFCDPLNYHYHVRYVQNRLAEGNLNDRVASYTFAADLPDESIISEILYQEDAARIEYGQTLTEYCRRTKQAIEEPILDFFGGGVPLHFLDPGVLAAYDEQLQEKWDPRPSEELRVLSVTGRQLSDRADFLRSWSDSFKRVLKKDEEEQARLALLPRMSLDDQLRECGFDLEALKETLIHLNEAARMGDRAALVAMVRLPFTINDRDGPEKICEDSAQLMEEFSAVFSEYAIASLAECTIEDLYVSDYGAMIARGAVWFRPYKDGVRIYQTNPGVESLTD